MVLDRLAICAPAGERLRRQGLAGRVAARTSGG